MRGRPQELRDLEGTTMSTAIAAIPYLVAFISYTASYRDLFEPLQTKLPYQWVWKASQSIFVVAFSPLVLAASGRSISAESLIALAIVTAITLLLYFIYWTVLSRRLYFRMQVPTGKGAFQPSEKMTPARITYVAGVLIIAFCAVGTLYVGSQI
jgi:hypothetical protein